MLSAEELEKAKNFYRYLDVDGDGIPIARCPACTRRARTSRAARVTTSTRGYTEDAVEYKEVLDRIDRKMQGAAKAVPAPHRAQGRGAKMGLVTVGGCHAACVEALDLLARDGVAHRLHARARLPVW